MVLPKEGTNGQDTVWQLRGLKLFYEIQAPCDESKHILFTDIAKYTAWIQEVIGNNGKNL